MNEKTVASSVFYVKKQLDNRTCFECAVLLAPILPAHRMSYSFTVCMNNDESTIRPERCDFDLAEKIFNEIVCRNLTPDELCAFVNKFTL